MRIIHEQGSGSASGRLREGFGSSSGSGGSDEGDDEGHPWRRHLHGNGHHEPGKLCCYVLYFSYLCFSNNLVPKSTSE